MGFQALIVGYNTFGLQISEITHTRWGSTHCTKPSSAILGPGGKTCMYLSTLRYSIYRRNISQQRELAQNDAMDAKTTARQDMLWRVGRTSRFKAGSPTSTQMYSAWFSCRGRHAYLPAIRAAMSSCGWLSLAKRLERSARATKQRQVEQDRHRRHRPYQVCVEQRYPCRVAER